VGSWWLVMTRIAMHNASTGLEKGVCLITQPMIDRLADVA
jgi:hypothetical protein